MSCRMRHMWVENAMRMRQQWKKVDQTLVFVAQMIRLAWFGTSGNLTVDAKRGGEVEPYVNPEVNVHAELEPPGRGP